MNAVLATSISTWATTPSPGTGPQPESMCWAALAAVAALVEGAPGGVKPWVREALAAGQAAYAELLRLGDAPTG